LCEKYFTLSSEIIARNSEGPRSAALYLTGSGSPEINNSKLSFGSLYYSILSWGGGPLAKIGGSMIDGIIDCANCKIVNSWDGSFNPIPNQ
jgi:hypothetical protein